MNERNGSTPGIPAAPSPGDGADYLESRLRVLSDKLERRGLETRLVTYPVDGVKGEHYDALLVANPASPERGEMHVEKDGCVTWEYPGSLDDTGIDTIADEATNALRANGIRRQPEAAAMTGDRETAGLPGTHQQQLVFLNTHWGSKYTITAPQATGGRWSATATFGQPGQIQALSAAELLEEIHDHYQANKPQGGRGDTSRADH